MTWPMASLIVMLGVRALKPYGISREVVQKECTVIGQRYEVAMNQSEIASASTSIHPAYGFDLLQIGPRFVFDVSERQWEVII